MARDAGDRGATSRIVLVIMTWFAPYIGLPFGEEAPAVTCWGLVCRIYAEQLAVHLPSYGEIPARDLIRVAHAMKAGDGDGWLRVDEPRAFDVVAMRAPQGGRSVVHVGVMIDALRMIHVEAATAAVIVPVRHWSVSGRILGYRRRA